MITAAAYIRVSDERQDEYSPASQLKKIQERADRDGAFIPEEYIFYDDGISAKSTANRTAFNRMIAEAKRSEETFSIIYVWKFSRFARNQEESLLYKNLLKKHDVKLISVSETIPDGAYGSLIERIIEWMDEFYLTNLSAETQRGLQEKFSRGEPVCAPPLGYSLKDKLYYPDENADAVREIFTLYADGESVHNIALQLRKMGVVSKKGNPISASSIAYVLNNPVYIGEIRRKKANLTQKGKHEAIIDRELWDRVQERLTLHRPKERAQAQKKEHPLRGLVKCSACGSSLVIKGDYLQCSRYNKSSCIVSHYISFKTLYEAVIDGLEQAVQSQTFTLSPPKPKKDDKKTDYEKLIRAEERRLERAREAFLAEIDTLEQYKENKETITARIEEIQALRERENALPSIDLSLYTERTEELISLLKDDSVSDTVKNIALKAIIEKIVFDKPAQTIAIYFYAIS